MTSALASPSTLPSGSIRAVCLDIDDTLVDYETSARSGLTALLGHDDAWPAWRRTTDLHHLRYHAGEVDFDTMRRERTKEFFAGLGEELDDGEAAEREEHRLSCISRTWRLFDDAWPCLEWLKASGLRLAVITNAASLYQRRKLAAVGLIDTFDHLVISEELGIGKPDPMIFHTACEALGVAPSETIHVGDRLDLDASGAVDAGLHGVWLDRRGEADRVPVGVSVISSLTELPDLVFPRLPSPR
ncbi:MULTISPECIES: HAD family hydrolase [Actinoalloteichus]|uniref:Haloacid dehalogenase superfamily enzyme, subfamily IA n=1 Tax=Actinoalloteichus fjordicus TaxID=1612552 RepID=A0AAC9PTZ3_9PSEU|nr:MULTISPECIES: HAD family hydrolase [Actinoalloteichus]APU17179.1 haloacid dehalogenase superfamily enzyme, subfamily IA [Actinoalloteichus fjordicus]APU23262.1 haloacid dehalogenase superfamily enzyme, subfamily IA [Actinoalloteichus sp. GBA129-24]